MRIKMFRAASISLAMAEIRDELGLDALILGTERVEGGVEVTAALEVVDDEAETFSPLPGVIAFDEAPITPSLGAPPVAVRPWSRHNLPLELVQALELHHARAACDRLFRFEPLPLGGSTAPLMLMGPPGSGKTLTIAKLATRLVLDGHAPMVITADDQRAGAVEQLAGFTRLLGLTLIAAGRPETLARAIARRMPGTPVLIDAPGLDLDDPAQERLAADLRQAADARPVLVLAAGIDPVEASEIAEAHAAHRATHLVATRLDRRGRLGGILAAARAADLALAEAGTAATVADGLEPFSADFLAGRLDPAGASLAVSAAGVSKDRPNGSLEHPSGNVISAHIAAQAGTNRSAHWKAST